MELRRRQVGAVQVFSFPVEIDLEGDASAAFKDVVRRLVDTGARHVVMDLERVGFVDSSGLGALISLLKAVRGAGGDLKLASLSGPVRTVLEVTRLVRVFETHETADGAARSFEPGGALASSGAREGS